MTRPSPMKDGETIELLAESAAHALYNDHDSQSWMQDPPFADLSWVGFDGDLDLVLVVRAVLTTLRDNVSDGMVEAGVYTDDFQGCMGDDAARPACKRIFTAMLAAALEQK